MGNITELKRGSLNGLRRQTNECLVSAYYKGYEDGKKEPKEVKAVNVEDTSEYQIGYKVGYDTGYNKGLEDAWKMVRALYNTVYDEKEDLYGYYLTSDIVEKLDVHKAFEIYKNYEQAKQEVQEKDEKEIKVGDIVRYATDTEKMIVTRVTNEKIETLDKNGCVESWKRNAALHKWGNENVADKLQALFEGSKESLDE